MTQLGNPFYRVARPVRALASDPVAWCKTKPVFKQNRFCPAAGEMIRKSLGGMRWQPADTLYDPDISPTITGTTIVFAATQPALTAMPQDMVL